MTEPAVGRDPFRDDRRDEAGAGGELQRIEQERDRGRQADHAQLLHVVADSV